MTLILTHLLAIFIASIAIPFVSAMIFHSASKTLRDVHFRFTFITLTFMIIHSTATIISNNHFAILYPLYLLNIIPALVADIMISSKRNRYDGEEKSSMIEREAITISFWKTKERSIKTLEKSEISGS